MRGGGMFGGLPRHPKRPRDPKPARQADRGEASEPTTPEDSPFVQFARSGGLRGGKARAVAGVTERLWSIADIVKVLEDWEAANRRRDKGRGPMIDRTTKILLGLIALGLWANLAASVLRPAGFELGSISSNLGNIANGTCVNRKICGD